MRRRGKRHRDDLGPMSVANSAVAGVTAAYVATGSVVPAVAAGGVVVMAALCYWWIHR